MFYILDYERVSEDIIEACGSIGIAGLINIVKTVLSLIQIIGPILCMIALTINFIKLMSNPDEKKYKPTRRYTQQHKLGQGDQPPLRRSEM